MLRGRAAVWLELGEAARLIDAAHEHDTEPHNGAFPHLGPLIATFVYTGGRKAGVLELTVADIEFPTGTRLGSIRFRANRYRKLKSRHATRRVQPWPELERRLGAYLDAHSDLDGLLFPAEDAGMLTDVSTSRQNALKVAKFTKHVTWHTLRHTYAATRMQTTDAGRPVSPYTVRWSASNGRGRRVGLFLSPICHRDLSPRLVTEKGMSMSGKQTIDYS